MNMRFRDQIVGGVVGGFICIGILALIGFREGSLQNNPSEQSDLQGPKTASPMMAVVNRTGQAEAKGKKNHSVSVGRRNSIVRATELAAPAVVNITVTRTQMVRYSNPFDDPFFHFFGSRYQQKELSSLGSGVILNADGYIVTNSHVLGVHQGGQLKKISVNLPDGRTFTATFVGADPHNDLAVIRIEGDTLPVARLQQHEDNLIGEWVVAIGNPYGYLIGDVQPSVTVGVISALNRTFRPSSGIHYHNMIQTDASINPGNSGGALVNVLGEVIGINTFIFTGGDGSQGSIGLGFAIPISKAQRVIQELIEFGYIREFTTGISTTPGLKEALGVENGIVVSKIERGSPGEKAGLKVGDVIYSVAGKKVRNLQDVQETFKRFQVGESVELGVIRKEKRIRIKMLLEEYKTRGNRP